jgi:DNA-binding transcriptional LysR family regulator
MVVMENMRMASYDRVDLNLLPALVALLEEKHVSKAAARAQLSQPAMSRALQRLRNVFGDELLVRTPSGYQLTPRAERAKRELASTVPQLNRLLAQDEFDAAESSESFRLAGTDYAATVFGAPLVGELLRQAPRVQVTWQNSYRDAFAGIEEGAVDLAFRALRAPAGLSCETLFEDRYVCVVAESHPLAGAERLSLSDFLTADHVDTAILDNAEASIDRRLAAQNARRRIRASVPSAAFALELAKDGQMLVTMPSRQVRRLGVPDGTRTVAAPPEIESLIYQMTWHPRLDGDPAHRWLRERTREAMIALDPASTPR